MADRSVLRAHALRTPVRASLGFMLTGVISRAVALVSTAVLTRLLSPASYGLYPLYTARLSLVSVLATWNLSGGILYRGMQRAGVSSREAFVRRTLYVSAVPFGLTACVCLLLAWRAPALWGMSVPLTCLMLLQIAVNVPLSLYAGKCRFLYRARSYATVTLLMAVGTPLVTYVLIRTLSLDATARLLAPAAVGVLAAVPLLISLLRCPPARDTPLPCGRSVLWEGLTLLPYALSLTAVEEVGRLILGAQAGTAALGRFGIAYAVGTAPLLLTSGVQAVLQPWLMRKLASGELLPVRQVLRLVCFAVAAATVALSLVSPELFALLAPPAYREAQPYVIPVALSVLPHMLFLIFTAISLQQGHTRAVMGTAVLASALSCALCAVLIPRFGTPAAAWMTAVSYGLLALGQYAVLRRTYTETRAAIDGRYFLLCLGSTAVLSVLAGMLASVLWLRVLLLLALAAVTLWYALPYRRLLTEP